MTGIVIRNSLLNLPLLASVALSLSPFPLPSANDEVQTIRKSECL